MNKMQLMTIGFALQLTAVAAAQQSEVPRDLLRFQGWSEELVLFSGAIPFDSCSPHSPQLTLTATDPASAPGQDPALRIETKTYYGACSSVKVFDFRTADILQGPVTGPSCPVASAQTAPAVTGIVQPEYAEKLGELLAQLRPIAAGQACRPARPELDSVVGYLDYVASELQRPARSQVAFEGPISFDSCSPHSPQHVIQVGQQQHVAGEGLVLSDRTTTLYGRCTSYRIFDFDTLALTDVPAYGPDCYQGLPLTVTVLTAADPAYRPTLQQLVEFLRTVAAGQACHAPAPQLSPALAVLEQLLRG